MKNAILISCLALFSFPAFTQATWSGGTPGHETDWMEARNWSNQRVPGWNDNAIIPHLWHNNYPEIKTAVPAIAHLEVEGGARLSITSNGYLPINGSSTSNSGILLTGKINNEGVLAITNTAQSAVDGNPGNLSLQDKGRLTTDDQQAAYALERH